jgi:hypothetical protein
MLWNEGKIGGRMKFQGSNEHRNQDTDPRASEQAALKYSANTQIFHIFVFSTVHYIVIYL